MRTPQVAAVADVVDIVDTAVAAGHFTTLIAAMKAVGLTETLKGAGPFTLFAPTNQAFTRLAKGKLDDILKIENRARLRAILEFHVLIGRTAAAELIRLHAAPTMEGRSLTIRALGGMVTIDGSHVMRTDIAATNGVIHTLDAVMFPK